MSRSPVQGTRRLTCRYRLFALLGVTTDPRLIKVNYSAPPEIVYTLWATERLTYSINLDIFSACADSRAGGLPSWVPDLRKPWGSDRALFCATHNLSIAKQTPRYKASGDWFKGSTPIEGGTLHIHGIWIYQDEHRDGDEIKMLGVVGDIASKLVDPTKLREGLIESIRGWEEMCASNLSWNMEPVKIDESVRIEAASIRFADCLLRGFRQWGDESHPASLAERFHAWRWNLPVPWSYSFTNPDFIAREKYLGHLERILFTMIQGCQMFVTAQGRVGMVGEDCHAAIGDRIFILQGGRTPYLLRAEKRAVKSVYRLMGPCYVDGQMGGFHTESRVWWTKISNISII